MYRITYVYRGLQGLLRVEGLKTCTGSPTCTEVCMDFCELRDLKRLPVCIFGVAHSSVELHSARELQSAGEPHPSGEEVFSWRAPSRWGQTFVLLQVVLSSPSGLNSPNLSRCSDSLGGSKSSKWS